MTRYDWLSQGWASHCNKLFVANTCSSIMSHKEIVPCYVVYIVYRSNTSKNAVGLHGPVGQVILFLWRGKLILLWPILFEPNNFASQAKLGGKNQFPEKWHLQKQTWHCELAPWRWARMLASVDSLDSMYSLLKHSKCIARVKSPHSSCVDWEELYRSDRQAGPYSPGLVGKPCCSVQHLQNCRVATKSNLWVSAYIRSTACSKCELVSPRKWLWSIYSFNRRAVVRFTCCNRVWKLTTLSLLQYLIWRSCQFQSLFWKHKHAFTCLNWIAGSQQMQRC